MSRQLTVQVRYFASLREALGVSEQVTVDAGATLGGLRDQLLARGGRHAEVLARGRAVRCALNQVMADESAVLADGAEVAFFPPGDGRMTAIAEDGAMPAPAGITTVAIQTEDFDLAAEVAALRAGDGAVGAVVSFVGAVRSSNDGSAVSTMELEHYPGMTERAIESMVAAAHQRFDIRATRVVHRVGLLPVGAQIVLVAVTSAHRGQAFQACEFLMDYLKTQAPFWKKETTPEGARWVDARVADDAALARWGIAGSNA